VLKYEWIKRRRLEEELHKEALEGFGDFKIGQ